MKTGFFKNTGFFPEIERKDFRCWQKCILGVHRKTLMKKFLLLNLPSHKSISDFQRNFFDLLSKSQNNFLRVRGKFRWKVFFWKKISFSRFSDIHKKNSAGLPNSFFWEKKFHHSGTWSDNFLASIFEKFLSVLSKQHSTRQTDRFDEK